MAAGKKRIYLLDELRGLAVFCMVFYHAFYSMSEFFNIAVGTKLLDFFTPAEPFFAALFIVISAYPRACLTIILNEACAFYASRSR